MHSNKEPRPGDFETVGEYAAAAVKFEVAAEFARRDAIAAEKKTSGDIECKS